MSKKYCYLFTEGNANMRELLGGKGANLAEMTNIGLPVPQGFTITITFRMCFVRSAATIHAPNRNKLTSGPERRRRQRRQRRLPDPGTRHAA